MRKAKSRFGGRLEPFFRLDLVLYEGRSDLLTVTSVETVAAHPRLREHAGALDGAARACEAVARIFDDGEPHSGVYHLLANELALLNHDTAKAGRANSLAFRLKLLLAAGFAPHLAGCASCGDARTPRRLLRRRGRRRLRRLRGQRVPARRGSPRVHGRRPRPPARRGPGRVPAAP